MDICAKESCNNPKILRGKYCKEHRSKPHKKCRHGKNKYVCKECGGVSLCKNSGILKSRCKKGCGGCGSSICKNSGLYKSSCKDGCDGCDGCGSDICKNSGILKSRCKEGCNGCGGSICENSGNEKKFCKKGCDGCGTSICKNSGIVKSLCKKGCDGCGGSICENSKIAKSLCKKGCDGCGGSICENSGIEKNICKEGCDGCGASICKHHIRKNVCRHCDIIGYIHNLIRSRVQIALNNNKEFNTIEYLGCDIKTFKKYIEKQFKDGMTWKNHGEWHIDHIVPIKYEEDDIAFSIKETIKRLHYTNTQPLWAFENISKGNRFIR